MMLISREKIGKVPTSVIIFMCLLFAAMVIPVFGDLAIVGLTTKILIFGLLAMSLDILVGYTGLWSFGHAALSGAASYTTAILLTRFEITSFWITAPVSILIAFVVACVFGFISLRVSGLYFLLVTLALGQAAYHTTIHLREFFGGESGIGGIPYPPFCDSPTSFFYFALFVCFACFISLYIFAKSSFGYSLQAIREDEVRMKCLGYNIWLHKYIVFMISGFFAGIAGVLYVHYNGLMTPSSISIEGNGLPWLMLIIGGSGTLWGALLGSGVIFILQYFISSWIPLRWPLLLGICFVSAVLFARGGILVSIREFLRSEKKVIRNEHS